jgi:DtxR family Mn-dependent transcriptional regulator
MTLQAAAATGPVSVIVDRISEQLQPDAELMHQIATAGLLPGHTVHIQQTTNGVLAWGDDHHFEFDVRVGEHVFVRLAPLRPHSGEVQVA